MFLFRKNSYPSELRLVSLFVYLSNCLFVCLFVCTNVFYRFFYQGGKGMSFPSSSFLSFLNNRQGTFFSQNPY